MSLIEPLQSADQDALAEGIARSSRRGFVRTAILGNRQAMVGLGVLVFFVLVAVFAPWLEPYDPTAKTGPRLRAAEQRPLARYGRRRRRHALAADRGLARLARGRASWRRSSRS